MNDRQNPPPGRTTTGHGFGTAPVFLASISTILGAILFLRFGYAVSDVGLLGTLLIIAIAHLVTIPTVLAVSEIATNRRVAGGGAYYIISRSFGTRIGGVIGITLYLSQAISVAFYTVAFAEAFGPVYEWIGGAWNVAVDPRFVSLPATAALLVLVLTKGAALGVRVLWVVCVILGGSIASVLFGSAPEAIRPEAFSLTATNSSPHSFAVVFAIIFPAFTGMIAGLGLSGDLKNPRRSIPLGTIAATLAGMAIYILIAIKLAVSVNPEELHADQFIMARIAVWGPSVYIGLAAATLSSALGSILVAPRTLQALAQDDVVPFPAVNRLLARGFGAAGEPRWAAAVSGAIAIFFVVVGDVDFIAQILTMFFLVTYGALCTVSFLEYFAGNPSYRPTFRTRWYVSLLGALMCTVLMLRMDVFYALVSFFLMGLIYVGLSRSRRGERDLAAIFQGTMFQLTRRLKITLQQNLVERSPGGWRPSVVAVTRHGERLGHFDLLRWISHHHGFGHFVHYFEGDYSRETARRARTEVRSLIGQTEISGAGVYVDSLISPSFPLALTQTLQMPGISGLPNNCLLLEFASSREDEIPETAEGARTAVDAGFNALVLRSTRHRFGYRSSIHLWLTEDNFDSAPLMLLLAYIIVGHPEWKRAEIEVFECRDLGSSEHQTHDLARLVSEERLPISEQNRTTIGYQSDEDLEHEVSQRSSRADLVIAGIPSATLREAGAGAELRRYRAANDVLFVSSVEPVSLAGDGAGGR